MAKIRFVQRFHFGGAEATQFLGVLAVPIDERALGHVDPGSDAGQAPTFGAQLEKAVFGFDVKHSRQYLALSRPAPLCMGRAVKCGTAVRV